MPKFLLDNTLRDCRSALPLPCQHCLAPWGRAAGCEGQIQGIEHPWDPALAAACPGANCGSASGRVLFPSKVLWRHIPGLCSLSVLLLWPPMAQGCKNCIRCRDVQWPAVTLWLKGYLSTCLFPFALLLLSASSSRSASSGRGAGYWPYSFLCPHQKSFVHIIPKQGAGT